MSIILIGGYAYAVACTDPLTSTVYCTIIDQVTILPPSELSASGGPPALLLSACVAVICARQTPDQCCIAIVRDARDATGIASMRDAGISGPELDAWVLYRTTATKVVDPTPECCGACLSHALGTLTYLRAIHDAPGEAALVAQIKSVLSIP